ncbi:MAG: polymer-forming cytoskeletal protein [Sphingomonadales bacterium]
MANSSPARTQPSRPASNAPSIIGSDVEITGNVSTNGEIQLDGSVEGDVRASSITLGENGALNGTVSADRVIVRGTVDGSINGRVVELHKSAKVSGDVKHETLSIEAGARVDGNFKYDQDPVGNIVGKVKEKPDFSIIESAVDKKSAS